MQTSNSFLGKALIAILINLTTLGISHHVYASGERLDKNNRESYKSLINLEDPPAYPVVVEAESGVAGSAFTMVQEGEMGYVTASLNYSGQSYPGDTSRIITLRITFPDTGYYHMYARIRIGSGGFDDDSFFSPRGFGVKSVSNSNDWVFINGLASAGFTDGSDIVRDPGSAGSLVWKWVNLTRNYYTGNLPEHTFYVGPDSLTMTLQIGSRENGLSFDQIAFGRADLLFTVDDLDNRLPGTPVEVVVEPGTEYTGPPLAEGLPKFLGNVLGSDPNFTRYWNQLTPENEGKWAYIGTVSDTLRWNWSNLDRVYNYARDNNLIFKNHTLIWGQQQPSWISSMPADQQLKYIEAWIRMVGQRYSDMDMIDVVNEPLKSHNPPDGVNGRANYKNALGGDGQTGWDWVIQSFVLARKYMPNTKLILNDYGIINDNNATSSYLQIINLLKDRGLIDGIGVQGHRFELENASVTTLKYNLDRLAATGLPIYISEMDLGNYGDSGTPDDQVQLQLFQKIFPVLWEHPGVQGITLWGYKEGAMWQTTCFLVRKDNTARPALTWLAGYLKSTATDLANTKALAEKGITLQQNYPNPFNSSTSIHFDISFPSNVTLKVYNILGEEVAQLMNDHLTPGTYSVTWAGQDNLRPGTYIYRLVAGQEAVARKMLKR